MSKVDEVAQQTASARRRWVDNLRRDLLNTSSSVCGYCQMLCDDDACSDRPPELTANLKELVRAAQEVYRFLKEAIDCSNLDITSADFDDRIRLARHEVINKLNHVLGLTQLLLMRDESEHFGALVEDLELIESKCKSCVTTLQRYTDVGLDATVEFAVLSSSRVEVGDANAIVGSRLLVVDDNQVNRQQLKTFLETIGATVDLAAGGREALAVLRSDEVYDLVLLDLNMPDMNGFAVLRELAKSGKLQQTPVIIVSGFVETEHVVSCIEMGAEDHLPKPVDFRLLSARVNSCLEKRRLREREFAQFFTPDLARHYVRHPELLRQGREAVVSVLFCDIRGFSRITERLGPEVTLNWLSDVMGRLSDCVIQHHGVLVDYIGDEIMAMWGAPDKVPNHAELACQAAIDILKQLPAINDQWQTQIGESTRVGIGLNSGIARVGNTGSHRKFKYGPLGNGVNLASRVQGATKYLRKNFLVTGDTYHQLNGKFASRRLCKVRVFNIANPVDLYEIETCRNLLPDSLKNGYEEALHHFERQELTLAASSLAKLLVDHPSDAPSLLLMSRVVDLLLKQPENFDPVWELPGK